LEQDAVEEFLVDRMIAYGDTPGEAVVAVLEHQPCQNPLSVCFALSTVAADLRSSDEHEYVVLSGKCFETAALMICDAYAHGWTCDAKGLRDVLRDAWGVSDGVFQRRMPPQNRM
jgi:hypothetical protein